MFGIRSNTPSSMKRLLPLSVNTTNNTLNQSSSHQLPQLPNNLSSSASQKLLHIESIKSPTKLPTLASKTKKQNSKKSRISNAKQLKQKKKDLSALNTKSHSNLFKTATAASSEYSFHGMNILSFGDKEYTGVCDSSFHLSENKTLNIYNENYEKFYSKQQEKLHNYLSQKPKLLQKFINKSKRRMSMESKLNRRLSFDNIFNEIEICQDIICDSTRSNCSNSSNNSANSEMIFGCNDDKNTYFETFQQMNQQKLQLPSIVKKEKTTNNNNNDIETKTQPKAKSVDFESTNNIKKNTNNKNENKNKNEKKEKISKTVESDLESLMTIKNNDINNFLFSIINAKIKLNQNRKSTNKNNQDNSSSVSTFNIGFTDYSPDSSEMTDRFSNHIIDNDVYGLSMFLKQIKTEISDERQKRLRQYKSQILSHNVSHIESAQKKAKKFNNKTRSWDDDIKLNEKPITTMDDIAMFKNWVYGDDWNKWINV